MKKYPLRKWLAFGQATNEVIMASNFIIPEYDTEYGFLLPEVVVNKVSIEKRRRQATKSLVKAKAILEKII